MSIIDEDRLLTDVERETYRQLLKLHGFEPQHFLLEVTEDQGPMDMNDINYIIILKIKAENIENKKSNNYLSQLDSQTWISEFENDLIQGYYN